MANFTFTYSTKRGYVTNWFKIISGLLQDMGLSFFSLFNIMKTVVFSTKMQVFWNVMLCLWFLTSLSVAVPSPSLY
jgi:hypothetical protein